MFRVRGVCSQTQMDAFILEAGCLIRAVAAVVDPQGSSDS